MTDDEKSVNTISAAWGIIDAERGANKRLLERIAELEAKLAQQADPMSRIAKSKLADLIADGYRECGVMIERDGHDGSVTRGAVSNGGMVIWWHPESMEAAHSNAQQAEAREQTMNKMVEVTQEDANNYCRVLRALGMEDEGDPVAEIERLRLKCQEHRDGRLAALERVATLERKLQEVGDLAASSATGPAQLESLKMIEELCVFSPIADVEIKAEETAQQAEAQEPVLFVSPEQLAAHKDIDEGEFGIYLPARKTAAGKFTQPLFTRPQPAQLQRLSEAEVHDWWASTNGMEDHDMCNKENFRDAVRRVENKLADKNGAELK